jgi:4-oxalocrotonate tautomerase
MHPIDGTRWQGKPVSMWRYFFRRLVPANNTEESMPEIIVYLLEGRTLEDKRALVKDLTAAVVKNLGAPVESVTVSLVETAKTAKGKGGVLFSDMAPR